jgi:hypothetical protein
MTIVLQGSVLTSTTSVVLVVILAVGPLIVLIWRELRRPSIKRPASWPGRALTTALPQAVAFGIVANDLLDTGRIAEWLQFTLVAGIPFLAYVGPAILGSRVLQRPLSPELAELDIELQVKIRSNQPGLPRWATADNVKLNAREIVITLQPSAASVWQSRISLADVRRVDARQAVSQDSPWIVLDDGHEYPMPSGEVVAVEHRHGTQVIPVYDAEQFADVVRIRASKTKDSPCTSCQGPGLSGS